MEKDDLEARNLPGRLPKTVCTSCTALRSTCAQRSRGQATRTPPRNALDQKSVGQKKEPPRPVRTVTGSPTGIPAGRLPLMLSGLRILRIWRYPRQAIHGPGASTTGTPAQGGSSWSALLGRSVQNSCLVRNLESARARFRVILGRGLYSAGGYARGLPSPLARPTPRPVPNGRALPVAQGRPEWTWAACAGFPGRRELVRQPGRRRRFRSLSPPRPARRGRPSEEPNRTRHRFGSRIQFGGRKTARTCHRSRAPARSSRSTGRGRGPDPVGLGLPSCGGED